MAHLRSVGFSAAVLISGGVLDFDMLSGGCTVSELKEAGFSIARLKDAGASVTQLKGAFTLAEGVVLRRVGGPGRSC